MHDDVDVADHGRARGDVLGRHRHIVLAGAVREPAVVAGGEPEHLRAVRADPDRDATGWRRLQLDAVHLVSVEPRAQRREALGEQVDAAAAREALSEALELAAVAAQARAEDHASAAEAVEGGQGERQILHASPRHRRDARAEHDPGRAQRARGEGDPRIRGRHTPREREVVPDEEAVPARRLGLGRELGDELRIGVGANVGAEEAVLHG